MISGFNCRFHFISFGIRPKGKKLNTQIEKDKKTNLVIDICSLLFNDDERTRLDDICGHGHDNVVDRC